MRGYAKVSPKFWRGATGHTLRAWGSEAQLLALYLLTNPHAHGMGIYYIPIPTISHETGIEAATVADLLARMSAEGFAHYNDEREIVWLPEMALWQEIGEDGALDPKNPRVRKLHKEVEKLRDEPFYGEFYEKYKNLLHLSNDFAPLASTAKSAPEASPKRARSSPQASSKRARSSPQASTNEKMRFLPTENRERRTENGEQRTENESKSVYTSVDHTYPKNARQKNLTEALPAPRGPSGEVSVSSLALGENGTAPELEAAPPVPVDLAPASASVSPPAAEIEAAAPWPSVETLVADYNALTPAECPAVRVISKGRRASAARLLRDFPSREFWRTTFVNIRGSPGLRGRGDSKWIADFDWLLRSKDGVENCVRVHDGGYIRNGKH